MFRPAKEMYSKNIEMLVRGVKDSPDTEEAEIRRRGIASSTCFLIIESDREDFEYMQRDQDVAA